MFKIFQRNDIIFDGTSVLYILFGSNANIVTDLSLEYCLDRPIVRELMDRVKAPVFGALKITDC